MMKKLCLILMILCVINLWAASTKVDVPQEFDSEVRLDSWDFNPNINDLSIMDGYEIDLITTSKGYPVFSWFGHTGLRVTYPDGRKYIFDYGVFAFDDDFYLNFAMGRLWYSVYAQPDRYALIENNNDLRTTSFIRLNLSPQKKMAIINFLSDNIQEGKSHYLYHYYLDNCATRIRDIINYATDGKLKTWAQGIETNNSFRTEAGRCLEVNPFWDFLLNFLQSGQIDKPNTLWEDLFLPQNLEDAILEFDGGSLVKETGFLVDNRVRDDKVQTLLVYDKFKELLVPCLISLALCALLSVFALTGKKLAYKAVSCTFFFIFGLMSLVLTFMAIFTDHSVTWYNENIIFINPLLLYFGISTITSKDLRKNQKRERVLLILSFALILCKIILPKVFIQDNLQQLLTVVPIYLVKTLVPFKQRSSRFRK